MHIRPSTVRLVYKQYLRYVYINISHQTKCISKRSKCWTNGRTQKKSSKNYLLVVRCAMTRRSLRDELSKWINRSAHTHTQYIARSFGQTEISHFRFFLCFFFLSFSPAGFLLFFVNSNAIALNRINKSGKTTAKRLCTFNNGNNRHRRRRRPRRRVWRRGTK